MCSTLKIALAELLFLHLVLKYQKLLVTFSEAILSIWLGASIFGWHMSIRKILNGFPKARERYFIFLKRYLFRTFNNITSNRKKGTFFALLRASLPTAKKDTFLVPLMRSLEGDKKVPFSRFKSSFGKVRDGWKVDNIDVKISSLESLKYPPFFSKKVPLFNFSPDRLALTKKVTILLFVLWKMNAES